MKSRIVRGIMRLVVVTLPIVAGMLAYKNLYQGSQAQAFVVHATHNMSLDTVLLFTIVVLAFSVVGYALERVLSRIKP